ncbi:hypothetical protein P3X46_017195 [Hevea brasiliensis]|uniref:Cytochrome P450 n=1 Tax=Hevea brasiliensis TaxID=3981 RepID=A0ABQ9M3N0_HEVBR|nr:hypothetical protein P3X46_017195 [Hevea brasiliensis]
MGMFEVIFYLSSCGVCLFFLSFLIKLFSKVWWTPIRIQSMMRSQGIQGPAYRFYHGNAKEIIYRATNVLSNPKKLSHQNVFPTVLPHIYSWLKLYEIFNNKDGEFLKLEIDKYYKKLLGDGIATTRGDKWFTLRRLSNHAFHAECLKGMIPAIIASVEMMLERWKYRDSKEIDAFQEFKVLTSEIISRTAFGSSYLEGQHIFDTLIRMAVIITRNIKLVKTTDDVESDELEKGIRNSIINMMKRREEAAIMDQSSDGFGSDFLGLQLKAHHDDNSDRRISVEDFNHLDCKTFYVAGHETTASSITWTLFLLAIHTDWQDKARKEMNMIINEALRLYPPVVNVPRQVQRQVRLGKLNNNCCNYATQISYNHANCCNYATQISYNHANCCNYANNFITCILSSNNHNPQIWGEDVHLFKPERFVEGVAKATNNNVTAYLPFSLGPRSCVGSNFAVTETNIAVSMILQHYQFTLSPTYVHSPVPLITMCPQHGLRIMLQPLHLG